MFPDLTSTFLRIFDIIFGSGLLLTAVTSFFIGLIMGVVHADISACIATLVGSVGLLMMSVYPIHLLLGGEDWISCIVEQYPAQREAFSGYVFVPTSFVVCAMFFGVTLKSRKVLTPVQYGVVFGIGVLSIFFATVLYQEIHIPYVSTQKLVLPCEDPKSGSWLEFFVELLNTSAPAQSFWRYFDRKISKPDGWDFPDGHQWSYMTTEGIKTEL